MIIVNQKKDTIINFNNITNIFVNNPLENNDGEFEIIAENEWAREILGYYKTEKRAIEVLVEIATAYTNMQIINIPVINIHENISAQRMAKNICYEMPEE